MEVIKSFRHRFGIFRELLAFLWHRKLWWLIPLLVVLVLLGVFAFFAGSSSVAPFIYSLF